MKCCCNRRATARKGVHEVASYLRTTLKLHVAVDMDGYSNEGVRLDGLFSLRVAPVQVRFPVVVVVVVSKN